MAIKEVTKKLTNPLRVKRLRMQMDELNYLDRVMRELVRPLQERRGLAVSAIREALLDEGIPPDAKQLAIDDEKMEARFTIEIPDKKAAKKKAAKKRATARKR